MADPKKPMSPATIAAFLAGAGFGVGTEIIIKPAVPEEPGWTCSVVADDKVFCKMATQIDLPPDDLVVRGTPDGGVP
jgi:hypothetical protein